MHQRLIVENNHPLLWYPYAVTTFNCFIWWLLASDSLFPNTPHEVSTSHQCHRSGLCPSPEQESKASSLNSSPLLILITTQGVNPERMTLAQGSRGPDRGERESRPRMRGRKAGPGADVQTAWESRPPGAGGAGLRPVSPWEWNGLNYKLDSSRKKLTQLSPEKVRHPMKISHCIRLTLLESTHVRMLLKIEVLISDLFLMFYD